MNRHDHNTGTGRAAYITLDEAAGAFSAKDREDTFTGEPSVIQLVDALIAKAVSEKASDIHIEPFEQGTRVRLRVDGFLREEMTLSRGMIHPVVSRIKVMAGMDIAERRLPQDGRVPMRLSGRNLDLRISTMPTIFGEKAVVRILDKDSIKGCTLEELGLSQPNLDRFLSLIRSAYGMVLVTGPTGSGKTTSLYTALEMLNQADRNIVTVEDPVEYVLEGINQAQVNVKSGFTFSNYLRSILRQDPDVIMIGEIRDLETSEIAVQAAITGHLVLSTLHTNDAPGAVTRLLDMGVAPFMVASSLLGVVAQRLVRRVCSNCRQECVPGENEAEFAGIKPGAMLFDGAGCSECGFTGYRGRIAVYEVMPLSPQIQKMILKGAAAEELREAAVGEGMTALKDDGIKKALAGYTTIKEIMRVAFRERSF